MRPRSRSAAWLLLWLLLGSVPSVGQSVDLPQLGQRLYNGIELPQQWPPRLEKLSREPMPVPYLEHPPEVVPIDVGRQLFVDDFLIERTTLTRSFHRPQYHPACPVLKPDRSWEQTRHGPKQGPCAMPFSDGVWYDPQDRLFKMWYFGDYGSRHLCYATSQDGVRWNKPSLDVVPGTNIAYPEPGDARTVWLDAADSDPTRRFKLIITRGGDVLLAPGQTWQGSLCTMFVYASADGIHWRGPFARTGPTGDRNSAFYNPFRKVWVFSIREFSPPAGQSRPMRSRRYWESPDLVSHLPWKYGEPTFWVGADRLDPRRRNSNFIPELYNLDAVAYESLMVGLFCILRDEADLKIFRPKINEVFVGFSRDGFHWQRPDRQPFLPVSESNRAWNWGNMQSAGGGFLVVGDQLYFYVSGRQGDAPHFQDAGCSTGLATLRRDGFASMDAGADEGELLTRPVRFSGEHLFVNVDADEGQLSAEILDRQGNVIEPFSRANCIGIAADQTRGELRWRGANGLATLADTPVRVRFTLRNGSLYAFWMSADPSGSSRGYVAAGGPGLSSPIDLVGNRPSK